MKAFGAMYEFPGRIVGWADGDTARVEMDIGFEVVIRRYWRLARIESWEPSGDTKDKAREVAARLTHLYGGLSVVCQPSTRGFDLHGRLRGELVMDGQLVSDFLVRQGFAWYRTRDVGAGTTLLRAEGDHP